MNNRHFLISKHGSIKKANEADSAIAKQILSHDEKAGERGVRSRKHKNPMRGLAAPQALPKLERHIQGQRDPKKRAVRMTYRMRLAGDKFKQPLTPIPFYK